jgi:hypothetical protein
MCVCPLLQIPRWSSRNGAASRGSIYASRTAKCVTSAWFTFYFFLNSTCMQCLLQQFPTSGLRRERSIDRLRWQLGGGVQVMLRKVMAVKRCGNPNKNGQSEVCCCLPMILPWFGIKYWGRHNDVVSWSSPSLRTLSLTAGIKSLRTTLPDEIFFTGDFASWTVHFVNICAKNQQMQQIFIQCINYVWYLLLVSALHCHPQGGHNTPIHNILSTAPWLSISQKALGPLPEEGNVLPKHVWATIHD